MILPAFLALQAGLLPPDVGGALVPRSGLQPWVVCPDGTATHGVCSGVPVPPAWLGLPSMILISRRIRQRIKEAQR